MLITIPLFKAKYERDDVQEGEGTRNPNTKKARMPPSLLRYDRLYAGLLKSRPWYAYRYKPRSSRLELSLGEGMIPFDQQQRLPHSRGSAYLSLFLVGQTPPDGEERRPQAIATSKATSEGVVACLDHLLQTPKPHTRRCEALDIVRLLLSLH